MTKDVLIEKIKGFDSYKDMKDYLLKKMKKDELIKILEELTGKKILIEPKKSSKKNVEETGVSEVRRSSKDKIKLSFGTFKEQVKAKFDESGIDCFSTEIETELVKPIWENILGVGYFEKYVSKKREYNDILVEVYTNLEEK